MPRWAAGWEGSERQHPAMRDPGVIDALDALERYARAFYEISREQDAHYSARSFVRSVRLDDRAAGWGEPEPLATDGSSADGRTPARAG